MNNPFRTRIAPTPSGYLHLGNAWSFLYTWLWARVNHGQVFLRIDAMDADRLRPEFLKDIQESLQWLGLDWDAAFPCQPESNRIDEFKVEPPLFSEALKRLILSKDSDPFGWPFACHCTRDQIKQTIQNRGLPPGIYPGTCRHQRIHTWEQAQNAPVIRWHIPESLEVSFQDDNLGIQKAHPATVMGDMVIRTRSGGIAYHLGSLACDQIMGITHIVRGVDLIPSTLAQMALAMAMGYPAFAQIRFLHHPLMTQNQEKLSKTAGAPSMQFMRTAGISPQSIWRQFAKTLDLPVDAGQSLKDLLTFFPSGKMPQGPLPIEEFTP